MQPGLRCETGARPSVSGYVLVCTTSICTQKKSPDKITLQWKIAKEYINRKYSFIRSSNNIVVSGRYSIASALHRPHWLGLYNVDRLKQRWVGVLKNIGLIQMDNLLLQAQ